MPGRRLCARQAARQLAVATGAQKNDWLIRSAALIRQRTRTLLEANERDCAAAQSAGLSAALIDRLRLTESRLEGIAQGLEQVATLPEPVGEIFASNVRPNGLLVTRVRVPLGVVFFIYESRPNVTVDAAALCVKSGNAVILRGGKEASQQSRARRPARRGAGRRGLPGDAVQLVDTTDRDAVGHFLKLRDQIDLAIPRGGRALIERVTAEATMPVLKHFAGICHVYVDASADLEMAEDIMVNTKCQRPGVCNAAESLLVHATWPANSCRRSPRPACETGRAARLRRTRAWCPRRGRRPTTIIAPNISA